MAGSKQSPREFLSEFIQLYRSFPCLWLIKSEEYNDRHKKDLAYIELVKKYKEFDPSADRNTVLKKINALRTVYKKELAKVKNSLKSSVSADEVYKPSLWYYDLMEFLNTKDCARSRSSMDDGVEETSQNVEEKDDISVEHEHELIVMDSFPITQFHTPSGERERRAESVSSTSRRRRRQPEPVEVGPTINDPLNSVILKEEEEDECDLYGRLLARKLRRLSELERLSFMHEIDGIFIRRLQENLQK